MSDFVGGRLIWDGSDWQSAGDWLRIKVTPTYSASNQVVKVTQPAKGVSSVVDVAIPTTDRSVEQRGSNFQLASGTQGPIRWLGEGGAYAYIGFSWTCAWLNSAVDTANAFYFGMKTGGSVPWFAQPVYLRAADPPRGGISISGAIEVLNGGQLASVLWPVISGASAIAEDALGWTEASLIVWDTGYRVG